MKIAFTMAIVALSTLLSCAQKPKQEKTGNNNMSVASFTGKTDTATFGTGCFWCTEAIFKELEGVLSVTSGYSGGIVANPTYKEVCTGETGHAECVQVVFDPSKISFDELLEVFWQVHDPTTLNRQGA
ncbi:MAG: peptide-methionine (S)-S-oxide reductase MsrA, partial [Bacteroidetes bacterium]|nr:peptide-methionine (S)-S-oxide reductase MsrA [Bacteroidota bacterium]